MRPVPIAERWLPQPVSLETGAGMHRFVWDLRWDAVRATSEELEEDEYSAPRGPRVAPGEYQVKLVVDGVTMSRVAAGADGSDGRRQLQTELAEQQRLGLEDLRGGTEQRGRRWQK